MKAYKKSKIARITICRKEYNIVTKPDYFDPYLDEGWGTHNTTSPKHKRPSRVLYNYQVRMYKTWKHNRKTQWKEKQKKVKDNLVD